MGDLTTRELLLKIGKEEFLAKGYKDASLREIGKKSGFTLGAFYGYFSSKEALFEAIVQERAEALYACFFQAQTMFAALPEGKQKKEMDNVSNRSLLEMLDIIYEDFDIFKLIFFRAEGTKYENYLQRFIDLEIESTIGFIKTLQKEGLAAQANDELVHILASAMFSGMMEVVDHDMSKEKAVRYVIQLRDFYSAGWHRLLGF